MPSIESELDKMQALAEDCEKRRGETESSELAAKLGNVEATARKAIVVFLMEIDARRKKEEGKAPPLASLSDDELKERKLKLVKELSK